MLTRDLNHPFFFAPSIVSHELSDTTVATATYVDMGDTIGPTTAVVVFKAATGTPDAQEHTIKIKEADSSGGLNSSYIEGAELKVTDDGATVVLQAKNRSKRYVLVEVTPKFTGGTTPKAFVTAVVVAQKERY